MVDGGVEISSTGEVTEAEARLAAEGVGIDYGVDARAEIVAEDDLVTGRLIGLQIKGAIPRADVTFGCGVSSDWVRADVASGGGL